MDKKTSHLYKQALATLASSVITMCSGLTFGITAVMLPQLKEEKTFPYDASYDSWIASIATIGMIVGSLIVGTILDYYGRRAAHMILCLPFILGWIVIALANSTTFILIGRFITGLSAGAIRSVTVVYVGEISDPRIRTVTLLVPGLLINLGVIYSHLVGHYFHWKISALICIAPTGIASIAFLFLKESPLWLITKGRIEEGIETFRWFRGTDEISEKELKLVLERQSEKPNLTAKETLKIICDMSFIKPTLLLMVLMVDIQFSGVNSLSFYSQDIFQQTFSGNIDPFTMVIITDCLRSVISLCICILARFIPRKIAFLTGSFGVAICLICLILCLRFDVSLWLSVLFLVIYVCFSSSLVTIGWTFVPEVLPCSVRGLGSGINAAFSYTSLFIVVSITPYLMTVYGKAAMFGFYATSTLICGLTLCFILPETGGKSLQSIEDSYNNKISEQNVKC